MIILMFGFVIGVGDIRCWIFVKNRNSVELEINIFCVSVVRDLVLLWLNEWLLLVGCREYCIINKFVNDVLIFISEFISAVRIFIDLVYYYVKILISNSSEVIVVAVIVVWLISCL